MTTKLTRHSDGQRICVSDDLEAPVMLEATCPNCGTKCSKDFTDGSYILGEWTTGEPYMVEFICECDHQWEVPVRILLDMELDQDGWFPRAGDQRAYQAVNLILHQRANNPMVGQGSTGDLLFLRRENTGWMDGRLNLPAGHLNWGESPLQAAAREAREELGITLDLRFTYVVCVIHQGLRDGRGYVDYFVECVKWEGEPANKETDKAKSIKWVGAGYWRTKLGDKVTSIAREGLDAWERCIHYKELDLVSPDEGKDTDG